MPGVAGDAHTIRDFLRAGTAQAHTKLDDSLGLLISDSLADYRDFLRLQYRARSGIENWLQEQALDELPPPQAHLIAHDLDRLDASLPGNLPAFLPGQDVSPLGVCWVLAGSALGNRTILARLSKVAPQWPTRFLSDTAMTAYWRDLLPQLQAAPERASADYLLAGAQATFSHFNAIAASRGKLEAA